MTTSVQRIAEQVKALRAEELEEFLTWLADYEAGQVSAWDAEIERDTGPSGRLNVILSRVEADIEGKRVKPLDEVIHNP